MHNFYFSIFLGGGLPLPSSNAYFKLIFKSTTNLSLFKDNQCPLSYRTVYYNVAMPKFTCTIQNNFNIYKKNILYIYIYIYTHIYIHIYVYLN